MLGWRRAKKYVKHVNKADVKMFQARSVYNNSVMGLVLIGVKYICEILILNSLCMLDLIY